MSGVRGRDAVSPNSLARRNLQMLAQEKLDDARLLLQHQHFSSSYYLAGYTVEFGLKACIAARFSADSIPDRDFVNRIYKHDARTLAELAGLTTALKAEADRNADFAANWAVASRWTPEARYTSVDRDRATRLFHAIESPVSGVLPWIQARW